MAAESHLEFYRRWHRLSKPYVRWPFDQFQPYVGRRVADVGCGLGNFTELLADRDFYLGIDLDEELLRELGNEHRHRPRVKTARRYTKRTLGRVFDGLPGRVERLYYFNLIGAPGWFVKGRVLKQKRHTNDNYALMNAVLPVVRPLERLVPPPFGMSVIGIFRKD